MASKRKVKAVERFLESAGALTPGFLFSFNIADFKRRNSHLGHEAGDRDIADLEWLLRELKTDTRLSVRASGGRWLLFSRDDDRPRVQLLINDYRKSEPIRTGWRIDGEKGEECATRARLARSEIRRALRCLFAPVSGEIALAATFSAIAENDFDLPVDRIIRLSEVASVPRQKFCCVTHYPAASPVCPFCGGAKFAWEGGDGSVFSGEGTCNACRASIDIRQVS